MTTAAPPRPALARTFRIVAVAEACSWTVWYERSAHRRGLLGG